MCQFYVIGVVRGDSNSMKGYNMCAFGGQLFLFFL